MSLENTAVSFLNSFFIYFKIAKVLFSFFTSLFPHSFCGFLFLLLSFFKKKGNLKSHTKIQSKYSDFNLEIHGFCNYSSWPVAKSWSAVTVSSWRVIILLIHYIGAEQSLFAVQQAYLPKQASETILRKRK